MRVLHLYSGNLYGGIERLLATLARERHRCPDMEPAFGLCFRGRLADELSAAGVPVFDLGPVRFSRPWTLWRARWRLARLLLRERFDAVVTHACWPHAIFAPVVRRARLRLALAVHDYLPGTGWNWYVIEGEPEDGDYLFFGFVAGIADEFVHFRLSELEGHRGPSGQTVERDLTFTEGRLTDVAPAPDL